MTGKLTYWFGPLFLIALMAGCGGGSNSGGAPASDTTPPKVVATTPAANATGLAINSAITATFSEAMDPATVTTPTPTATFTVAGVTGTVSYDATNKTAIFRPTVNLAPNSTYTATITTGAKDLAGNAMAADYTWKFTTSSDPAPDTTPPEVSSTIPASVDTGVAINSGVLVNFSEAMDPATVTPPTATFTVAGVTGTVSIDTTNRIAIFRPSGNLASNTTYTATVKATVKDLAGNAMAADYTWSFTTGSTVDTTPPTVNSADPQPGATNVPANTKISLTFNEPVVPFAAGTIDGRPAPVEFSDGNTKATMTPTTDLKPGATYSLTFVDMDLAGNRVLFNWGFKTKTQ